MKTPSLPGNPDYQQLYNEAAQRADQYQSMYVQTEQYLKDYMRETLQLRKYIHALEVDALNAFMDKQKYFEPTTSKCC